MKHILLSLILSYTVTAFAGPQSEAIFAGGCFWCMEPPFDKANGVFSTTSGYTGGEKVNPTYEEVSSGKTGHYEVIKVIYDAKIISYRELLNIFWKNIDPLDGNGQFCDKGQQYESAIFYQDDNQKKLAEETKASLEKGQKFQTRILKAKAFYPAEDYHQDYYKVNPIRYKYYPYQCGRDKRLEEVWKK
ncbi:MAG: peptide-methionine (S)-S-oxide reductase MsrA [Bdellovibrionales bacterium]|nr:peptide-methionine (S)-S-oxide reductase MsrA [Bdellovibrionales bacterium]